MLLTDDEQCILNLISSTNNRITQQEIAASQRWLGSHPVHEIDRRESTLRKIRQVIRDLRIKKGYMILSDAKGMAKSQARAWFETYNAMRKNFNLSSDYFEKQGKLF